MRHTIRGNILFLILLAVVLFAALSYAVTSSMRGGGKDASGENYEAAAADIINYMTQIDVAVQRMMMTGGLKPEQISFSGPIKRFNGAEETSNANANCTSDTCRVFRPDGGNVAPRMFEKYAVFDVTGIVANPFAVGPGQMLIAPFAWPYAGTAANDIVITLGYIKPEICDVIARRTDTISSWTRTGSYIGAEATANWDVSGVYGVSSHQAMFIGKRLVVYRHPTPQNFCAVYQLVFER